MALDLSEFTEAIPTGCKVRTILSELEGVQVEKLTAALGTPEIGHQRIANVLRSWGHKISPHPIARHRAGECSCGS